MGFLRVVARLLISTLFVMAAFNHYQNFTRDAGYIKAQLALLNIPVPVPEIPQVLMGATIFLQAAGGILLGLGISETLGAQFLAMFLVPTTLIMHAFWAEKTEAKKIEQLGTFLKNLSLLGGVLFVLASHGVVHVRQQQKPKAH